MAEEKRAIGSAEAWRERVARWRASGLTSKEFAAKEGLSSRTLSWWAWHLDRQQASATTVHAGPANAAAQTDMSFVPVMLEHHHGGAPSPPGVEVVLTSEIRVRIWPGFDETTFMQVVHALERL